MPDPKKYILISDFAKQIGRREQTVYAQVKKARQAFPQDFEIAYFQSGTAKYQRAHILKVDAARLKEYDRIRHGAKS